VAEAHIEHPLRTELSELFDCGLVGISESP
jgi:hypothetical protein